MSHELSQSARIDGFDISAAQYPHPKWLPTNVHLREHDVFKPFSPEHLGVYDVAHVRFFLTLLGPANVQGFIENLMTLLSMILT